MTATDILISTNFFSVVTAGGRFSSFQPAPAAYNWAASQI